MNAFRIPWIEGVELSSNYFDEDHYALSEKLNALLNAISSEDRTLVLAVTDALVEVAKRHFENEEQRMRECQYHSIVKHSASHFRLLESLGDFQKRINLSEDISALLNESAFLEQWLVPHLTTDDKQFAEFLSAQEYLRRALPP